MLKSFSTQNTLEKIRNNQAIGIKEQILLTIFLSTPAILAQLSSTIMQYIDASMVGKLGTFQAASVGLVSTSIWLLGGLCSSLATGFSVLCAHKIGAKNYDSARKVLRQAISSAAIFSSVLMLIGVFFHRLLVDWLTDDVQIKDDAAIYFLINCIGIPIIQFSWLSSAMLRSSGNVKIPSLLGVLMCVLDVVFNFFLIFPTRQIDVLGLEITVFGADLGVKGAAIGSVLAELISGSLCFLYMYFRSKELSLFNTTGSYIIQKDCLKEAVKIASPMALEHLIMCSAYLMITIIVSPLGVVALAAHSFGITVESLCYMPGYGIGDASTTLVGQSIGAKRIDLVRRFAFMTTFIAMFFMTLMGVLMYIFSPELMSLMTQDSQVIDLGVKILKLESFAEPLYAASIVIYSVFVGMGDSLKPCLMNFASMWCVRIVLAWTLSSSLGLYGVWLAMFIELNFRGIIFLVRLFSKKWVNNLKLKIR